MSFDVLFTNNLMDDDDDDEPEQQKDQALDKLFTVVRLTTTSHQCGGSPVWQHFGKLQKDDDIVDNGHVYCMLCLDEDKTKKYQTSTSTGNLMKHLWTAHKIQVETTYRVKRLRSTGRTVTVTMVEDDPLKEVEETGNDDLEEIIVSDLNEVLIAEVAARPQLFVPNSCKNRNLTREKLWLEIHEIMNHLIPIQRLPKIWKNIRDRYFKTKKELERSNVDDSLPKPKYRYFEHLRFLDALPTTRKRKPDTKINYTAPAKKRKPKSTSKLVNKPETEPEEEEFDVNNDGDLFAEYIEPEFSVDDVVDIDNLEVGEVDTEKYKTEKKETSDNETTIEPNFEKVKLSPVRATPSKVVLKVEQINSSSTKKVTKSPIRAPANLVRTDECSKFGDFIAEVMRNMTPPNMRACQMKMLQVLFEFET